MTDNGSEFINHHLLAWCETRKITFTRSRPGNSNDGAHVEQKNWAILRTVVGYHRYDTEAELLLLNTIWTLQSQLTNYFSPQQTLVSKVRDGAKVSKKYGVATTPYRRADAHKSVTKEVKAQPPKPTRASTLPPSSASDPGADRRAADPRDQQGPSRGETVQRVNPHARIRG